MMTCKRFLYALFLISSILLGFSDTLFCQPAWIKKIDLDRHDSPNGLIQGDSMSFYITHRNEEGSGTPVTQNLTKFSTNGEVIWNIQFQNYPYHVFEGRSTKLPDDDLIVSFLYEDSINLEYKVFRITPDGIIKWSINLPRMVQLEIDYGFEIYKIIPFSPNDIRLYFWMNYYWDFDPPSAKNGFLSLDSLGTETFRTYFDTGSEYHRPYNMVQSPDTQFLRVYSPKLGSLELILRYELLDKDFNQIWSYQMGPQDDGGGGPSCIDANGNVYFTWNHDTTGNGSISHQLSSIFSLDNQGRFRWSRHFGEDRGIPIFYDIISMSDGRIIACGQEGNAQLSGGNYRTGWIVCIDTSGNKLWERRYILDEASESGNNFYYEIESDDGGLILLGIFYKEEGGSDVYVMKTDYDGCVIEDCGQYIIINGEENIMPKFGIGTKWTYEVEEIPNPIKISFRTFMITDTAIINLKKVFVVENNFDNGKEYMYVEGSKIYFWDVQLEAFQLNYDFGETIQYQIPWMGLCDPDTGTIIVHVDSISNLVLDVDTIKIQHLSLEGEGSVPFADVYQNIGIAYGGLRFPVGIGLCDFNPYITKLRCFESDTVNYHFVSYPCDSTWVVTEINHIQNVGDMIHPNPSTGIIYFEPDDFNIRYELFDFTGQLVEQGFVLNQTMNIQKKGLFILKYFSNHKWKVVKLLLI